MSDIFVINNTVDIIQTLACIAVAIGAAEIIYTRHQYSANGIYNYALLKTSFKWMMVGWTAPIFDLLLNYPRYIYLVAIQLAAALLIISHLFTSLSWLFVVIILLIYLLSHLRNQYGTDGSDQMQTIIFASLTIFYLSSDLLVKTCCIFFICFQALIAYMIAGYAKLGSSAWQRGTAIYDILNTQSFGNQAFAQILEKNTLLSRAICWSVITFECAFPLLVFTGVRTCLLFIVAGILFHLSIALFMGLNTFFWSFIATYPAILFFSDAFQTSLSLLLKWR
jgi:hypothetical protein